MIVEKVGEFGSTSTVAR